MFWSERAPRPRSVTLLAETLVFVAVRSRIFGAIPNREATFLSRTILTHNADSGWTAITILHLSSGYTHSAYSYSNPRLTASSSTVRSKRTDTTFRCSIWWARTVTIGQRTLGSLYCDTKMRLHFRGFSYAYTSFLKIRASKYASG